MKYTVVRVLLLGLCVWGESFGAIYQPKARPNFSDTKMDGETAHRFDALYRTFLRQRNCSRNVAYPSTPVTGHISVNQVLEHLGNKKVINNLRGKCDTLLKSALRYKADILVIKKFLTCGATPYVPFKRAGEPKRRQIHLLLFIFDMHTYSDELLTAYFAPDMRTLVFPGGIQEALTVFKNLQTHLRTKREEKAKLAFVADLLRAWAQEVSIDLTQYDLPPAINSFSPSKTDVCKEECAQAIGMSKKEGVTLDYVLPSGKTLKEAFDFLFQENQLFTPRMVSSKNIELVSLIRLAIKRNAQYEVLKYLLQHGAPVTFSLKGEKKGPVHILWDAMSGPVLFETLEALFCVELRDLVFPEGVSQARKLFTQYKYRIKTPSLAGKVRKTEQLVHAWEEEPEDVSLVSSESIESQEDAVLMPIDEDVSEVLPLASVPMEIDEPEDLADDEIEMLENHPDFFAAVCNRIIEREDKKVIKKAIQDNTAFFAKPYSV